MTDTGAIGFAVAIRGNAVAYAGYYLKDLGQMCFSPPTPAVCVTETVGDTFMWNAFTPVRACLRTRRETMPMCVWCGMGWDRENKT